jgi:putative addiction module component (TIGR02574 family)
MVETALSKDAIIAAFKRLNADDQLEVYLLLREVVPSLDAIDNSEAEISDELKAELEARHARMLADPSASVGWEDVKAAMDRRLKELS